MTTKELIAERETKLEQMQNIAEKESVNSGFDGKITVEEKENKPNFSAHIDALKLSNIKLTYNPEYEEEVQEEGIENILDINALENVIVDNTKHEINHKKRHGLKGCPRNIKLHAKKILEPIAKVLKEKNIPDMAMGQTLSGHLANMFEDWVVDSENSSIDKYLGGWLFYRDAGNHFDENKYVKLFDAFIKLQLWNNGNHEARTLVKPFLQTDEKITKAVSNFLERTNLIGTEEETLDYFLKRNEIRTKQGLTELSSEYKRNILNQITDENNWHDLARIFAEEFTELIDPSDIGSSIMPLIGQNEFEEEMQNEETRTMLAWDNYKEDENKFEAPSYMDNFEALDYVYKNLARKLDIKVKTHTKKDSMELFRYGKTRKFDPEKDRGKKIKPYISENGKLELGVSSYSYETDIKYHSRPGGLPGIQFVMLDTSASMREELKDNGKIMNPWANERHQWTDTSKYHYALLSWYGLLNLLGKKGTLKRTNMKFANFAHKTNTATNLNKAKKLALTPQFGMATEIDPDKINDIFSKNGMLTITMSDGDIHNWDEIKDEFIKKAKKQHYCHIQIEEESEESEFCEDLKKAGLKVVYDTGKNVPKLIVDFTKNYI